MDERRKLPRGRCLVGAQVIFNGRTSTMSCTMRNQSDEGGLLIFGELPNVPERFSLAVSNRMALVPARVAWRSGFKIGVAFGNTLSQSGLRTDAAQHIDGLIGEKPRLRLS